MSSLQGWIKLHRKLMTSDIFRNEKLLKVFIYCLMKASHCEYEQRVGRQTVNLQPGQFVFGRKKAAVELEMKESTIRDYMNLLKSDNCIDIKTTNKYSVVTLINWDFYQSNEENPDNKTDNKKTAEGQQINTNKNLKHLKNGKEDIKPYSRNSKSYDEESIYFQLAARLFKNITKNNPTFKIPNLQKWADEFRLIVERDKRTEEQLIYLIDWCQQDSFWKANILSPKSLRKQFDRLVAKIKTDKEQKKKSPQNLSLERPSHWEEPKPLTEEDYRKLRELEAEMPY